MDSPQPPSESNENEEWCSVKKNKKKKQKQRALNLQQFHSETGDGGVDGANVIQVGSAGAGESRWGGAGTPEAVDPARPDLSAEEELMAASVHSYFTDLLTRCGAIRVDDPALVKELDSLAEEGRAVIDKFGGLLPFLAGQEGRICVVDSFLCLADSTTIGQAKNKALDIILNNVMPRTSVRNGGSTPTPASAGANNANGSVASNNKPAETNAWAKRLPAATSAPSLPNLARAPGAPTMSNGLSNKPLSAALPDNTLSPILYNRDIFSSSLTGRPVAPPQPAATEPEETREQLTKTCDALTTKLSEMNGRNHQLVQKLDEKTREADGLRAQLQMQKDALDRMEREKQNLSHEVNRLNALLKDSVSTREVGSTNGSASVTSGKNSNELILSLQSQLESERLNARNLKQQLDIERSFSGRPKMPPSSVGLGLGHHHHHQTNSAPTSMDLSGAGTAFLPASGASNSLGLTNLSFNFGSRSNQSSIGGRNPPGLMGLGVPPPGISSPLLGSSSSLGNSVDFGGGVAKETMPAPVSSTVSKNKLLLDNLSRDHPGLTDNDLQMALRELRQKFGNLSVMPLDRLTGMLRAHISEGGSK